MFSLSRALSVSSDGSSISTTQAGDKQSEEMRRIHAHACALNRVKQSPDGEKKGGEAGQAGWLAEVRWMLALGGTSQRTAAGT